jgi:Arc/MetJ family transcription regulator
MTREGYLITPLDDKRENNKDQYLRVAYLLHIYVPMGMLSHMRTTIEISDELFRQAKKRAADERRALREIVENALRAYLGKQPKRKAYQLRWRTERGRLLPGVRLDDRDALFDLMDGRT